MLCSISGELPKYPVVSIKSGHVFEKDLIEKYIGEHHKCPITGDSLSVEDLLSVQVSNIPKPKPPTATSVPALLRLFQSEWDALMLETFTLKKQYQEALQELSNALYQNDAACRVIARLTKERDAAREALTKIHQQGGVVESMDVDQAQEQTKEEAGKENNLSSEVEDKLLQVSKELSKDRKTRKHQLDEESVERLKAVKLVKEISTGIKGKSPRMVAFNDEKTVALTGGDKQISIFSLEDETQLAVMKTHTKPVNSLAFSTASQQILSASGDKSVRGWSEKGSKWASAFCNRHHQSEVVDVCQHPVEAYYVSFATAGEWSLNDGDQSILSVSDASVTFTCGAVHQDGLLIATGDADGHVKIWDIRSQTVAFECPDLHKGGVGSMVFSDNGYYFATASAGEPLVRIWDLRKLAKVKEISLPQDFIVSRLRFDSIGSVLGVCGPEIRLFLAKQWTEVACLSSGKMFQDFDFTGASPFNLVALTEEGQLELFSATSKDK